MWKIWFLTKCFLQNQSLTNFEKVIANNRFSSFSTFWNFCPMAITMVTCQLLSGFTKKKHSRFPFIKPKPFTQEVPAVGTAEKEAWRRRSGDWTAPGSSVDTKTWNFDYKDLYSFKKIWMNIIHKITHTIKHDFRETGKFWRAV